MPRYKLPGLSIAANQTALAEGNSATTPTPFTFTVTRTGNLSAASSVKWAVVGIGTNPANAADFGGTLPSGTVTFAAGQSSQVITVNVVGDTTVDPNEAFAVRLSGATGATIRNASASSTIIDAAGSTPALPVLSIAAGQTSKAEGNSGSTPFTFTVTRTGDTTVASSVNYTVTGSGANPANAADFGGTLPSGTVTFAPGVTTSQPITINVAGDTTVEPDEGFTVTLSGVSGATIGTATASSTILNDDTAPATKKIALTFDDGPSTYTPQILAELQKWGVHATFFEIGEQVADPTLVQYTKDLLAAGDLVENHTWDHPYLTKETSSQITTELTKTSQAIEAAGGSAPQYYRPPYGEFNSTVNSVASGLGMKMALWTVDTNDWNQPSVTVANIVNAAVNGATDNGIILMHDGGGNRSRTVAALDQIIPALLNQGYELVTIDKISALPTQLG